MSGTVILTETIAAFSSARCMRLVRIPSECTRSARETLVPNMLGLDDHRRQRPQILDARALRRAGGRRPRASRRPGSPGSSGSAPGRGAAPPAPSPATRAPSRRRAPAPPRRRSPADPWRRAARARAPAGASSILLLSQRFGRKKATAQAIIATPTLIGNSHRLVEVDVELPEEQDGERRQEQLEPQEDLDGVLAAVPGPNEARRWTRQLFALRGAWPGARRAAGCWRCGPASSRGAFCSMREQVHPVGGALEALDHLVAPPPSMLRARRPPSPTTQTMPATAAHEQRRLTPANRSPIRSSPWSCASSRRSRRPT